MPTALPRLPQASRPKVPVPCLSAGGQPYQSLQSRRTTSAGASTREALELGRPQRQEEMGTQRPSCTRWPGGQRQPGGGRTSKIRCSDRCARWIPPDGAQSLRLAPSARPPVPRVTWSPHHPQGRSSPPCVAQPRGTLRAAPGSRALGEQEEGRQAPAPPVLPGRAAGLAWPPGRQGPCRHCTRSQRSTQLLGHWLAQPRVSTVSRASQLSPEDQEVGVSAGDIPGPQDSALPSTACLQGQRQQGDIPLRCQLVCGRTGGLPGQGPVLQLSV